MVGSRQSEAPEGCHTLVRALEGQVVGTGMGGGTRGEWRDAGAGVWRVRPAGLRWAVGGLGGAGVLGGARGPLVGRDEVRRGAMGWGGAGRGCSRRRAMWLWWGCTLAGGLRGGPAQNASGQWSVSVGIQLQADGRLRLV